jgi:hypothetical protein
MALNASDPADRVEQLIVVTERLTERLSAEAAAFEARRPHEAAAGLEETARLANLYRHESARVKADRSLVAAAPEALRSRLIRVTGDFESMLSRHARALEAAKIITEGLVRTIAAEVAAQRAPAAGYGADARAGAGDVTSITLNRRA